jgi:riboflavin kinase/FMN adenylyltransferase
MQYTFKGIVIKGDGYGRKIGFPTINIERRSFSRLEHKPRVGVYTGYVKLLDTECLTYKAGIVIGPIDKAGLPKIEAHLIGYSGNLYGKVAIFEVGKFIRKFKKFKTERELIAQIKKDLML